MDPSPHPTATHHLPIFIAAPGSPDTLLTVASVVLLGSILAAGVFFFWLHSLPERMVHNKVQFDIVAVLALLSLFTHIHAFWVAALIIALIDFSHFSLPQLSSNLARIAGSLESMAAVSGAPQQPMSEAGGNSTAQSSRQPSQHDHATHPASANASATEQSKSNKP